MNQGRSLVSAIASLSVIMLRWALLDPTLMPIAAPTRASGSIDHALSRLDRFPVAYHEIEAKSG